MSGVENSLDKVLSQIDDCLSKPSDSKQVDFLVSLREEANRRLDEIEKAHLQMAIAEWSDAIKQGN
jgi:hypothetical protein